LDSDFYAGCGDIDAEDALIELGLENVSVIGGGEVEFSCPFDGHVMGDAHPSNHLNADKLVFRCKSCHRAGTLLDLVGSVLRCSPIEALRWLRQRYGEEFRPLKGSAQQEIDERLERWSRASIRSERRRPNEDETIGPRSIFAMDWRSDHGAAAYMRSRGFTPETLDDWGFGFDRWTHRVTIPVRDEDGVLVGFKGRSIDPSADVRYSLLGDKEGVDLRLGVGYGFDLYDTSAVVFGMDRARRAGRRGVLVEGELNTVAMHDASLTETVALGMSSVSSEQLRILRYYFDELVIFLDLDPAGVGATWGWYDADKDRHHDGLVARLSGGVRVLVVPAHDGDPASMSVGERRTLVEAAEPWMRIATTM
jgi:DNA primase